MKLLKFISTFFKIKSSSDDKSELNIAKYDVDNIVLDVLGITLNQHDGRHKILWTDIERIQAYKIDLLTTDEVCLDIWYNNKVVIVTEETKGWDAFIQKLRLSLPLINEKWEEEVIENPFKYNLMTIYERHDRIMPASPNFYSVLNLIDIDSVKELFKSHGWQVRKSAWDAFELQNSWSALELENDQESLLLHGLVTYHPANVEIIKSIFDSLHCDYKFEFYEHGVIMKQVQNAS